MTEDLETAKEIAKAVQETGKVAQGVIELVGKVGGRLNVIMGTTPDDLFGYFITDRLKFLRIEKNLEQLEAILLKADRILGSHGVKDPEPIDPKHAIPAFEAMAEEADETLQDLWARLLANAMDPGRDIALQRVFIATLREFEPLDVLVFEKLATAALPPELDQLSHALGGNVRPGLGLVSLNRLVKLECARIDGNWYELTPLGKELRHAVGAKT